MFERMQEFQSELTAGWKEATASKDVVANTKVVIQQAKNAQKSLAKVIAVAAKLGGPIEVLDATLLGEELGSTFDSYSNATIIIALAIELMAHIDLYVAASEEGVKLEEAKGHN